MPTITDDIGVWNNLGYVTAAQKQWVKFPVTATGTNATLRASFQTSNWKKLNSYVLIRPSYQTAASVQHGRAIRLYPEAVPIIFELPIPQDLQDRSVYFRDFEVKKVLRYRKPVGVTPGAILQITLEELWG